MAELRRLDAKGLRAQALAIPNLFTYIRLVAVPVFVWAYTSGHDGLALGLFIGAALTDNVDGILARVLDQRTALGGILDPVADKLLTVAALVVLAAADELPLWLLGLVLVKELGMAAGVQALRRRHKSFAAAPSRLGKYATFLLAAALALALARRTEGGALDGYLAAVSLLAVECVIATIVQYFARWKRLMQAP